MNQYVVWVEFGVAREHRPSFSQLVRANAVASLRNEAGCSRFDVLTPASGDGSDVALYEVYDSEAAFGIHIESDHYREFAAATAQMITHKTVRRFALD